MTRRLVIVATLVLIRKSLAFIVARGRPMTKGIPAQAAVAPIDRELESWASSSGYGSITRSVPVGSSGWASFRRVEVSDPPPDDDHRDGDGEEKRRRRGTSFFVKFSPSRSYEEMFRGEALGLEAMRACSSSPRGGGGDDALRIPRVYRHGDCSCGGGGGSFLIMEYLDLAGRSDDRALGRAVARMHLAPPTEEAGNPTGAFGFPVDNTM
jgi:protein-ribulosamine 3-kinase